MNKISYNKLPDQNIYTIDFNKIELGEFVMLEDGYYSWFPPYFNGSCLDQWVILDIGNKLVELNRDWDNKIKEEFSK